MNLEQEIRTQYLLEAEARDFFEDLIRGVKGEMGRRHIDALDEYRKVELGLGVKAMKSWRAIASLFFGGFEEDPDILLRSLVDAVVDMKFITLDPEERARRFVEYELIHRLRWFREGKKRLGLAGPDDQVRLARFEKKIEARREDLFKRRPYWKSLPPGWASEKTPEKFDAIKEPMLYITYMQGCAQIHPNVVTVGGYFEPRAESVEIIVDPRVPKQSRVFIDACAFLHRAIDHLNDVIHLGMDTRCRESRDRVDKLLRSRLPELHKAGQAMLKQEPTQGR